jgi:hypothetical protein
MRDQIIISIAVFSHGMEYLLDPFKETSEVGKFYKEKVRVYSQSCVPDIVSITGSHTHMKTAKTWIQLFQKDTAKTGSTASIMKPHMETSKIIYKEKLGNAKNPTFDQRVYEKEYIEKSCGIMSYLANKTFAFSAESDPESSLEGMVVLDVRVKRTQPDGTVTYERIMDVDKRNRTLIDITTYDGLTILLNDILGKTDTGAKKKTKAQIKAEVKNTIGEIAKHGLGMSDAEVKQFQRGSKLSEIDLIQLHKIIKMLNVDYVNIADYSCRSCNTGLTNTQIDSIYKEEQNIALLMEEFGGRKRRTLRNRKKHRKSRKRV